MYTRLTKIDWLSYTDRVNSLDTIVEMWQSIFGEFTRGEGRIGYRDGLRAFGITILYNPSHDEERMGVHIDITGQGCDMLYSSGFDVFGFITQVLISSEDYGISRLDVAHDYFADDDADFFPYDDLVKSFNELRFVSLVHRTPTSIYSHHSPVVGETCSRDTVYFGSAKSERRLTIYNKLAEKHDKGLSVPKIEVLGEVKQWIRFEFRLRNSLADIFVLALKSEELKPNAQFMDSIRDILSSERTDIVNQCILSIVFIKLLSKFVRFCDNVVSYDSSRSAVCGWWAEFVDIETLFSGYAHISNFVMPSRVYKPCTFETLHKHVSSVSASLYTFLRIFGVEPLLCFMLDKSVKLPRRYQLLLNQFEYERSYRSYDSSDTSNCDFALSAIVQSDYDCFNSALGF